MKQTEEYDLLVLGSGEAGKYIAWTLAKKGMKTALIERKYVGGSCPNIACLPSKNVIHSAKVASYFWKSATASERLLYSLMFALPLVGWGMLSAGHHPIVT